MPNQGESVKENKQESSNRFSAIWEFPHKTESVQGLGFKIINSLFVFLLAYYFHKLYMAQRICGDEW